MTGFKSTLGKRAAQASLLALVIVAALAVSGIGAASALAAPECVEAEDIAGKGSSLQKVAQEQWTSGYNTACPGAAQAQASYTSTGSGPGLEAFRFTGAGSIDHTIAFVGTDDAPTTAQIEHAEEATTGGKATGANPLIIPVAETAIAVVFHAPASCTLTFNATHGITWHQLTAIFGGRIEKWSELTTLTPTGAGCESKIIRVVRSEGSGTTYQFKNYLAVLAASHGGTNMPCDLEGYNETTKTTESTTEWAKMKAIHNGTTPNTVWPEPGNCAAAKTEVVKKAGGGAVAEYVAATAGTIGYAALPDAKAKGASTTWLQNEEGTSYAKPEAASGEVSACGTRQYSVPAAGQRGTGSGESVDWSQVFGASPTAGGALYPLCTLTYDISWSNYEKAGYSSPTNHAKAVHAYLSYIINEKQSIGKWYQPLPETTSDANDVLGAAKLALGKIGVL